MDGGHRGVPYVAGHDQPTHPPAPAVFGAPPSRCPRRHHLPGRSSRRRPLADRRVAAASQASAAATFQLGGQVVSVEELPAELSAALDRPRPPPALHLDRLARPALGGLRRGVRARGPRRPAAGRWSAGRTAPSAWPTAVHRRSTAGRQRDIDLPVGVAPRRVRRRCHRLPGPHYTFGRHPYLDGESAAYDVINMVRAARQVEPSLSN